ncbi:hypothetical protein [Bacillus seohaeanensis]|uniref:Uncharacterized protein n=1 Tax=Bacillus seohaeanensis TaxID=284580 RepID=A0ABW5RW13_9BACI
MSELIFVSLFVLTILCFKFFGIMKNRKISRANKSVAVGIVVFSVIGITLTVLFYLPNAS